MKVKIFDSYDEVSQYVASIFVGQIIDKSSSVIGLATGSSPMGAYSELINYYKRKFISFQNVTTFNLDEYCGLSPDNINSYAYFMNDKLFNHIDIKKENINIPNGTADDIAHESARYEEKILAKGGIDLQLLGIGVNGHLGFNEPEVSFGAMTRKIQLTPSTLEANKKYFDKEEDIPKYAISMGIKSIMLSKRIVLIATGESKAEAIKSAIYGAIEPNMPASVLQLHPNTIFVLDKQAAKLL